MDLSRLLIDIYGNSYMRHRRLESLLDFNGISRLQFLTGQEEAEAFQSHDYVKLHQSTLRKVDVLADIAERADRGILKTYASWWTMHGGTLRSFADAVSRNNVVLFVLAVLGGAPTLIGLYAIVQWVTTHLSTVHH